MLKSINDGPEKFVSRSIQALMKFDRVQLQETDFLKAPQSLESPESLYYWSQSADSYVTRIMESHGTTSQFRGWIFPEAHGFGSLALPWLLS